MGVRPLYGRRYGEAMNRAVLFDLDETLMVEEPAAEAAFLASAHHATGEHDVNAETLALGAATGHGSSGTRLRPTATVCG